MEESAPKLSVIIPVYDVADYLSECLDSVVQQSLDKLEIIIVNDASPALEDEDICLKYAEKYEGVKYFRHDSNLGLGAARNTGLKNAKGDYVWFVDSDDYLDLKSAEQLVRLAEAVKADVVAFSATSFTEHGLNLHGMEYYYYHRSRRILDQVYDGEQFIRKAIQSDSFHVSACLHMFRRKLLSGFTFREAVLYEDTDFVPMVIREAERVYCVKYAPYYRRIREGSITQTRLTERMIRDGLLVVMSLIEHIQGKHLTQPDSLIDYAERQYQYRLSLYRGVEGKTSELVMLCEDLSSLYEKYVQGRARKIEVLDAESMGAELVDLRSENSRLKRGLCFRLERLLRFGPLKGR